MTVGIEVDQNDVGLLSHRSQGARIILRLADYAQGRLAAYEQAERLARQRVVTHDQNADSAAPRGRESRGPLAARYGLLRYAPQSPVRCERFGRGTPRRFSPFTHSTIARFFPAYPAA